MRDYKQLVRLEARLIILKALAAQDDERMNSSMLRDEVAAFGIDRTREWIHEELKWMSAMDVIIVHELHGIKIAQLTEKGARHLRGAETVEGIRRASRPQV